MALSQWSEGFKAVLKYAADELKGSARRIFMAKTVKELGPGGQRRAERELGWNRGVIRKGMHELDSGFKYLDAFGLRGRKKAEEHLPHLIKDIQGVVDPIGVKLRHVHQLWTEQYGGYRQVQNQGVFLHQAVYLLESAQTFSAFVFEGVL